MVNEQMRGAEETVGKGAAGGTTVEIERSLKATALFQDVGIVNEQVRGADDTVGKVRSQPAKPLRLRQFVHLIPSTWPMVTGS